MRWLFADPHNPAESGYVRERIEAIDHWWSSFQAKAADINALFRGEAEWNLPKFMEETLQAVDPRLMWEFGEGIRGPGHRLVITPESRRFLRPMLRTLFERAPRIEGWEFYPYRPPETPEKTVEAVKARVNLSIGGAMIDASLAPGRKVDVQFVLPRQGRLSQERAMQAAFVATEVLLGEQLLDTWVGEIGLVDDDHPAMSEPLPLDQAQAAVATIIRRCLEQLPAVKVQDIAVGDDWATVNLDRPERADDYPARSDLVVATTCNMELFEAIHGGQPFASACHSRVGEQFCYLKLDIEDKAGDELDAFRAKFADTLDPVLLQSGVGCTIGGGTGLRYVYVDLALSDIKRSIPLIRNALAEQRAPLRSWLLFHDDDFAAEWVGIYRETPRPPLPPELEVE